MTIDKKTKLGYIATNHWNCLIRMEMIIVLIEKIEVISIMNIDNEFDSSFMMESNITLMERLPDPVHRIINLN